MSRLQPTSCYGWPAGEYCSSLGGIPSLWPYSSANRGMVLVGLVRVATPAQCRPLSIGPREPWAVLAGPRRSRRRRSTARGRGSRTAAGAQAQGVLLSLLETCRRQARSALEHVC
jgi:hypothetical protein